MKVLVAMLDSPGSSFYGLALSRTTGLKSGTIYPLLDRMEEAGWLVSHWEDDATSNSGGPRRRFYALTGEGIHQGRQVLIEHSAGGFAWS